MIKLSSKEYVLNFSFDAGTSRGVMKTRKTWFILLQDDSNIAIGECAPLEGLSLDSPEIIPGELAKLHGSYDSLDTIRDLMNSEYFEKLPSIRFGLEMAIKDLEKGGKRILYDNSFIEGKPIPINGLIWMGDRQTMSGRANEKVREGFNCIKIKVGALDFEEEIRLLTEFRRIYGWDIELRLDANGAFDSSIALQKLERLSAFKIHSIEQPIEVNQWDHLSRIIRASPIPIALDEELIPLVRERDRLEMISYLKPQYIILKPSLLGGFCESDKWIQIAENANIGWWVTSALESNIGLNAIAQFTASYSNELPQGLGTGSLYLNNFQSPLYIENASLLFDKNAKWDLKDLLD